MSHDTRPRTFAACAALVVACALGAVPARGQSVAPVSGGGGASAAAAPVVEDVTCRAGCAGIARARAGAGLRLTGEGMDGVRQVVFRGRKGKKDDVVAPVAAVTPTSADVVVPRGARSGAVQAVSAEGLGSNANRKIAMVGPKAKAPAVQARVDHRQVFVGGSRKAAVSFFVGGERPAAVVVGLVRKSEPAVLATWALGVVAPGTVGGVAWDGLISGQPAPEGSYVFKVMAAAEGSQASAAQAGPPTASSAFRLLAHRFPVAGPHDFGEFAASFGGGRDHKGQDVFAKCGVPLVAAIGGTVKHVAFQSRAGNYIVIAGADGFDQAYMHMQAPATLKKGDPVATGDRIGAVGDTGRASGCHLHFEMWAAPGWYTGGTAVDPLPFLKAWDAGS